MLKGRLSLYFYHFYFYSFVLFSLDLTHLCTTLKTVFRNSLPFARNPASPSLENAIFIFPQLHLFTSNLGDSACVSEKVQDIQLFGIVRSYLALVRDIQSICKRTMPNSLKSVIFSEHLQLVVKRCMHPTFCDETLIADFSQTGSNF